LAAFGRVIMAPGETATVKLVVPARAFAHYDPVWGGWFVEAGEYEVQIGASSRDIRGAVTVRVDADGAVP
jgi:beta-glucosidase